MLATEATMAGLASLTPEVSFSATTTDATDASSNPASFSSTPPTSASPDSMSLASEPDIAKPDTTILAAPRLDADIPMLGGVESAAQPPRQETPVCLAIVVAEDPLPSEPPSSTRPRRARASLPVYNLAKLSGTDNRGKRRANGDIVGEKRRRTISGDTLVDNDQEDAAGSTNALLGASKKTKEGAGATQVVRRVTRLYGAPPETLATKISTLGKRGKKSLQQGLSRMSRELRRLQDTNEFAHIDTRPVRYTVWSNGKYVEVDAESTEPAQPPRKKARLDGTAATSSAGNAPSAEKGDEPVKTEAEEPAVKRRRVKKYLEKGLYAGQETPLDITKGLTTKEKRTLASIPGLMSTELPNKTFPLPIFNGLRLLINGRDFKLPYDVCNPLPPGQPKPAAYRTMTRNRFVGDAAAYWKKTPHFGDSSKCVCKPDDGCGEDCQNRIMLYECDETNCNVGKEHCQNRAFQTLQERTKKGGRYRVGVEVYKTADRGYGVRSNRCFEPNQIIMEYTGEIITEEECERRMNEVYKDNECYYLMSFDQNMIIDATTGSIARFVNHSCSPNCRMIKWIVSGQPRMALFAGDNPIMTGDELTYDYNFDPFSAKNVQKCLCGSPNCRGVLGPKPKEVKPPKPSKEVSKRKVKGKKGSLKGSVQTGKRKLQELLGGDNSDTKGPAKKRKIMPAKGAAKKTTAKGKGGALKAATKGAATAIKRSVSKTSVKAKTALSKKTAAGFVASRNLKQTKITFKSAGTATSSRSSSLTTIVAATADASAKRKGKSAATGTPNSKRATPASSVKSARTRTPSRKVLEGGELVASPGASAKKASAKPKTAKDQEPSVYDFPS